MVKTEKSVLKFSAEGYVQNPELYGQIYKQFIQTNLDDKGNVIDDTEQSNIVEALRNALTEMDRKNLAVVIEQCVTYENFGGSKKLLNFIDITKRFVIAVEHNPKVVYDYLLYWERANPMTDHKNSIENLTVANLSNSVYNYLEGVINKWNANGAK